MGGQGQVHSATIVRQSRALSRSELNADVQQEVPFDSEIIVAEPQPEPEPDTVAKILRVVAEHYRVSVVDIPSCDRGR
jgi:hypothetical protein